MKIAHLCFFFILFTGCLTIKTTPEDYSSIEIKGEPTFYYVRNTDYDEYGRPEFINILNTRPTNKDNQFIMVYSIDNKPVKSFTIAITKSIEKPSIKNPLRVI